LWFFLSMDATSSVCSLQKTKEKLSCVGGLQHIAH